jgi:hypothetical protein
VRTETAVSFKEVVRCIYILSLSDNYLCAACARIALISASRAARRANSAATWSDRPLRRAPSASCATAAFAAWRSRPCLTTAACNSL